MLNKDEVAMLESLIRRMAGKQRSGLDVWLNDGHDGRGGWANNNPLWPGSSRRLRSMCIGMRCRQERPGARQRSGNGATDSSHT